MRSLAETPDFDRDFSDWLAAWKLWLLAVVLGALFATAVYYIVPPKFRASAAVTVDHSLEEAWPDTPDKEIFYYLQRETEKLESVAWADATLEQVAVKVPGMTLETLRRGVLSLSQPQDGEWHFWADSADSAQAQTLAAAWAEAFVSEVQKGMEVANELDAVQSRFDDAQTAEETKALVAEVIDLQSQALGITPYLQVSLMQTEQAPVSRVVGLGTYLFAGSSLAVLLTFLYLTFFVKSR